MSHSPDAGRLDIERVGGFAGFGAPGSPLRSRGSVEVDCLSATDRHAVDGLFEQSTHHAKPAAGPPACDGFRYRLTRRDAHGSMTVEVTEDRVPAILKAAVRDELI